MHTSHPILAGLSPVNSRNPVNKHHSLNRGRVGWDTIGFPGPASLAEVHTGRYSTLAWFADQQPEHDPETDRDA